jgi:hypothetical protein
MNREQALDFMRPMLPAVAHNIEKDGHMLAVAFLLVRVSPETGEPLLAPKMLITPLPWENQADKQAMMLQLRSMAKRFDACLAMLVTEAWYVEGLNDDERKSAEAHIRKYGSLQDFPDVQERIIVHLEHSDGAESWEATIRRSDEGVRVDPFQYEGELPSVILDRGVDNPTLTN